MQANAMLNGRYNTVGGGCVLTKAKRRSMLCGLSVRAVGIVLAGILPMSSFAADAKWQKAEKVVKELMAPEMAGLKTGVKTRTQVAEFAIGLIGNADTSEAKMLLAQRAFSLYGRDGDVDKALESLKLVLSMSGEMTPREVLSMIEPIVRGLPPDTAKGVQGFVSALKVRSNAFDIREKTKKTLEKSPKDSAARLKLAKAEAVFADWPEALKNFSFVRGPVAEAAKAEQDGSWELLKLADFWWDYAGDRQIGATVGEHIKLHAAELYKKCIMGDVIGGLEKVRVEKRIDSVSSVVDLSTYFPAKEGALYCIVDLSAGPDAERYPVSYLNCMPPSGWTGPYKTTRLVLRRIEPGKDPLGRYRLTKTYYAGVYEVTQQQWALVMGETRMPVRVPEMPRDNVSFDAVRGSKKGCLWPDSDDVDEDSFLGRLRSKTGISGFDLPTVAQWQYACRAGTRTYFNTGNDIRDLDRAGWYDKNSQESSHEVGLKQPNAWGLYDMHGNLSEWCLDWAGEGGDSGDDPVGPTKGEKGRRCKPSGAWSQDARVCSSGCVYCSPSHMWFSDSGVRVFMTPGGYLKGHSK